MGALDFDQRNNRTVSQYAPRHHRLPPGAAANGPALERLSRGGPQDLSHADLLPPEQPPIHANDDIAPLKIPLSMTGRVAAAMGVVTAATFLLAIFLKPSAAPSTSVVPSASAAPAASAVPSASAAPSVMPTKVHTVSIRPDHATMDAAAPLPAPSDANALDRANVLPTGLATSDTGSQSPLAAPLTTWAMFPDDAGGFASNAPAAEKIEAVKHTASARPARAAHHKLAARHVRHAKRRIAHYRSRRRHTRTAAAKRAPAQQAAPAEAQANAAQPIKKNPIQAALDKIFSNNGGSSGGAAPASAATSAPTGAAFQ